MTFKKGGHRDIILSEDISFLRGRGGDFFLWRFGVVLM